MRATRQGAAGRDLGPASSVRDEARARRSPGRRAGAPLLALQRAAGNRVVCRLVQAKLTVGPAADAYEQEADRVAEAVMRSLTRQDGAGGGPELEDGPPISRTAFRGADPLGATDVDEETEAAIAGARPRGRALEPALRSRMESAFGSDFGGVRIHQGPEADGLSRSLQARAFTTGADIFFVRGAYQPGTRSGQGLLAHELTHVVQQGAARRTVQRAILAIDGPRDGDAALGATRSCLSNLKSHKRIRTSAGKETREYPAGDARGAVFGPAVAGVALHALAGASSTIGPRETIYLMGHGGLSRLAGLTPLDLAGRLVGAFAGYADTFIGALKIVACYSASTIEDGKAAITPTSYAERTRTEIDTRNDAKFRPRFVEGIRGIAWADEATGQRVGYEVLGERPGKLSPLEEIYVDPARKAEWFKALLEPDPAKRKAAMDKVLEEMHKDMGLPPEQARRVLGKAARERYVSGSVESDFGSAADQLLQAAQSKPPNGASATSALERMRLYWEIMTATQRTALQRKAIGAYDGYLMAFQGRRASWLAMAEEWPL